MTWGMNCDIILVSKGEGTVVYMTGIPPIADPSTVEANKPAILWSPETNAPDTDAPAKEGCGSVIGMSAVAVLAAASAFVALKKKD